MADDRLQIPDALEKAFEYAKAMPTDIELAKKRASAWEQVASRGSCSLLRSRWMKPIASAVAGLAVAFAAVLVPHHLPEGAALIHDATIGQGAQQMSAQGLDSYFNKVKMYQQEGKNYMITEQASGYDLVEVTSGDKRDLFAVRGGVEHKVYEISKSQKFELASIMSAPLVTFNIVDAKVSTYTPNGDMYILNTDDLKVNHISFPGSIINQIGVWDQRPHNLSLIFSTIDGKTNTQDTLYRWDWTDSGSGNLQKLYVSTNEVLHSFQQFGSHLVLEYPNQLFDLTDTGLRSIAKTTDQELQMYGKNGRTDLLIYSVGQLPDPKFGSYGGHVQLKTFTFATGKSQDLLTGVSGDQGILTYGKGNNILVQNFVAEKPDEAIYQNAATVQGTYQIWMVRPGEQPTLVYKERMSGEHFYYPEGGTPIDVSKPIPLVQDDPNLKSPTASLTVNWENETANLMKVHP